MNFETLRVKNVCGVLRYRPTVAHWTNCRRKNHFIGIKLSGSALHTMEKKSFVMSSGDIYFFNQRDDYRVDLYEAGESLSIHFTTYEEITTDSFCLPVSNPYEIISVLQKAENLKGEGNELKLLSLLYEVCDIFEKLRTAPYARRDGRMTVAKSELDRNFTAADCLENAICKSDLGDRRFRDLFRRQFGMTPNRYITFKRIEYAKALLSAGGISVTEVSELCGFSDVYYFSKVFKKMTGISPSAWE